MYICVCVCVCVCVECAQLCLTLQPHGLFCSPGFLHQASLSMEFSRQEYWSGLPFPTPEDLLDPGSEHEWSLVCLVLADLFFTTASHGKPCISIVSNR